MDTLNPPCPTDGIASAADACATSAATINCSTTATAYNASLSANGLLQVNRTGNTQLRLQFTTATLNSKADDLGFYSAEARNSINRSVRVIAYQ